MKQISELLRTRRTSLLSNDPPVGCFAGQLALSKRLGAEFDRFDPVRQYLANERTMKRPFALDDMPATSWALIKALAEAGILIPLSRERYMLTETDDKRRYILGGWLEELVGDSARHAGADEVMVSVKVSRGRFADRYNEIDVIARTGTKLHFISCKALRILPELYKRTSRPWTKAAREIRRRTHQYGQRGDSAILITSLDLFKNRRARPAMEYLHDFARHHKVGIIGFENLAFEDLASALNRIFRQQQSPGLLPGPEKDPVTELHAEENSPRVINFYRDG